jgi:glycosyltransferase involved in cell wall biosynthesis
MRLPLPPDMILLPPLLPLPQPLRHHDPPHLLPAHPLGEPYTTSPLPGSNPDLYNRLLASRLAMAMFRKIAEINYKNATWIIATTPQIKQSICIQYRIDPDRIIVLSNGADVNLFKPMDTKTAKELLALDEDTQYVCFVGALSFYEGVEYLIRSAPLILDKCPSAGFLIVGDGPSKGKLMNLTQQIGVSAKFVFTGAAPHEDVPMYINASEVCVCPGTYRPMDIKIGASSLKIFEYMACGKPVVTADNTGNEDVITESNAGIVVCPQHSHELAGAVAKLLRDNQLSQRLGENGIKAAIEKYSWTSIAKRTAEACQEAVKRRKCRGAYA